MTTAYDLICEELAKGNEEPRRSAGGHEQVFIETANVLLVGDRVNLFADQPGAPFGWATVVCVTDEVVELVRPYVHTGDFTCSAGHGCTGEKVIDYIGQERVTILRTDKRKLHVVFRSQIPK